MNRPELVFWFNSPPRVERGAFNYVTEVWGNTVTYASTVPFREERTMLGWEDHNNGKARVINLSTVEEASTFLAELDRSSPHAIHIVAGFSPPVSHYLKLLVRESPSTRRKIVVYSERPGVYGPLKKRILKALGMGLKQRLIRRRYESKIDLLMPLGALGVESFSGYGWQQDQMVPFMYCPDDPASFHSESIQNTQPADDRCLRILYVGRFSKYTKGTDILMSAVDRLSGDKWRLDLVGGYGDLKTRTVNWAADSKNVRFLGSKSPEEISHLMPLYDICVVPSRFDGWNVVINEAILAGIGVICTDQTVSHELISVSGAGKIVAAGSADSLAAGLQEVIDSPEQASTWKSRARDFSSKIDSTHVGQYLVDILDYHYMGSLREKPTCPWMVYDGDGSD